MNAAYDKPLPVIDPLTKPYWGYARAHLLSVQHCPSCGDLRFPPCDVCPVCLAGGQEWVVVSGRASLVSWVRFHRAYWDGYRHSLPYDVCLVKLDEGPLILSNFRGGIPEDVHAGMALQAVFDDVTNEISLVRFVAAEQ